MAVLRARSFSDIKSWAIKVRRPPSFDFTDSTLASLANELWDVHLDIRSLLEHQHKKHLRFKLKIVRSPTAAAKIYTASFAPADYSGADLGTGNQHINVASEDGSYFIANIGGTPTGGFTPPNNTYWVAQSLASPPEDHEIENASGQFFRPPNEFSGGSTPFDKEMEIELIRLNYRAFSNIDVVGQNEDPTPDSDEFKNTRTQVANNLHTDGAIGYLMRPKDGNPIMIPTILRTFPTAGPYPNLRDSNKVDELGTLIHPPELQSFDRVVGGGPGPITGAPFWLDNYSLQYTNSDHVAAATYAFGAFIQVDTVFGGLKVGYFSRNRVGVGIENLSVINAELLYVD